MIDSFLLACDFYTWFSFSCVFIYWFFSFVFLSDFNPNPKSFFFSHDFYTWFILHVFFFSWLIFKTFPHAISFKAQAMFFYCNKWFLNMIHLTCSSSFIHSSQTFRHVLIFFTYTWWFFFYYLFLVIYFCMRSFSHIHIKSNVSHFSVMRVRCSANKSSLINLLISMRYKPRMK